MIDARSPGAVGNVESIEEIRIITDSDQLSRKSDKAPYIEVDSVQLESLNVNIDDKSFIRLQAG